MMNMKNGSQNHLICVHVVDFALFSYVLYCNHTVRIMYIGTMKMNLTHTSTHSLERVHVIMANNRSS